MAYGYKVKNNKKSTWYVSFALRWGQMHFATKREALNYMRGNAETMVLVRERTWLEKDDELRAFNTTQTEQHELIMWDADKGLMLEKGDGWKEWNVSKTLN